MKRTYLLIVFLAVILFLLLSNKIINDMEKRYIYRSDKIIVSDNEDAKKYKIVKQMKKETEKMFMDFPGTYSVYYLNLNKNLSFGINEHMIFPCASIIKIPVMLDIYDMVSKKKISFNDEYQYQKRHYVEGGGVIRYSEPGGYYTVRNLCSLMITESDNIATDMLIEITGFDNINKKLNEIGCKKTKIERRIFDFNQIEKGRDNISTTHDVGVILKKLYFNEIFKKEYSQEILNIMTNVKRKDMIPSKIPEKVKIAHKTGQLDRELGDCAIVYQNNNPYILCLMAMEITDMEKAIELFAVLSKKIYTDNKKI